MEENEKSIMKLISSEKVSLQDLLRSFKNLEKLQRDSLNNLYKIKQEVAKIEKTLKQSKLDDFVKRDINRHVEHIKSKIPEWQKDVKKTLTGERN